jgi:hypothetical protein
MKKYSNNLHNYLKRKVNKENKSNKVKNNKWKINMNKI